MVCVCVCVSRATGEEEKKNIYNNNIILLYVRFRVYVFNEPVYIKYYYYYIPRAYQTGRQEKGNAGSGGYGDFVSRIRFLPDVPDMDKWAAVVVQAALYSDFYKSKNNSFFFLLLFNG